MNAKYLHDELLQFSFEPDVLYSYCLFESSEFSETKHLAALTNCLAIDPEHCKRSIIFRTTAFADFDFHGAHVIEVPQLSGFQNHLYRYLAVAAPVETVVCLGADEPRLFPDFAKCIETAKLFNFAFVATLMESHPTNIVGGRCAFYRSSTYREKFVDLLLNYSTPDAFDWNLDQAFLSNFIDNYNVPTVFNAPVGVFKALSQRFFLRRLETAPTIVVRERNKYDKKL